MRIRPVALAAAICALSPLAANAQQNPAPIETEALSELDAWTVSALTSADGALGSDLWEHSDAAFLALVLGQLPSVYVSPAAQNLARRVLLSGGSAPQGEAQAAARQRFEALGKMGAADELATIAAGAGAALNDPAIAQFSAQAELARGRRPEACARGRAANVGERAPPFLLRLRAYCAAVTNDRAAADLALELARSVGADDAWFTGAVAAAAGAPGPRPPAARYDSSLATQLSLAAHLRPGPGAFTNATSTFSLLALARSDQAPQPQRAQAAALAFQRGALSAADTRAILIATPAEVTVGLPPSAIVLRQVQAAPGSLEAATAISGLLRQASLLTDFAAAARLFKDDIAALQNAPDQAAALTFARAAIIADDSAMAQRLIASARAAEVSAAALAPLELAFLAQTAPRGEQIQAAMQRRIESSSASGAHAAARDIAIIAALGAPLSSAGRSFLFANAPQGGAPANAGLISALTAATERGAVGEGALLAVLAASDPGLARLDADSIAQIIRALRTLRLDADARRFAVEALLAGAPT